MLLTSKVTRLNYFSLVMSTHVLSDFGSLKVSYSRGDA